MISLERRYRTNIDGNARIELREHVRELLVSRLTQQHGTDAVAAGFDHAPDDETALRDEDPAPACQFRIRNARILDNSGVRSRRPA